MEHLCIDDFRWATKGSTCVSQGRHKECDSDGENCVKTTAKEYEGFPMLQNHEFGGKKFCGKKIMDDSKFLTFMNVERNQQCSEGKRNCGSDTEPICISNQDECLITDIRFITKQTFTDD